MSQIIDKILTEWAYRVPDGMPNPKNPLHIIHLEESMNELKIPREVAKKVLEKVRKYVDNPQNRKLDRVGKPWGSKGTPPEDTEKTKDDKKDTKTSDEITPKQESNEKKRNEEISKVLDLFTKSNSETKGSGRFKLDENDVKIYTDHLNLSPKERQAKQQKILDEQKKKIGEISDTDIDIAIDMLKEKLDKKAYSSLVASIKKKGDPPGEFTAGEAGKQRFRNVIKHYLQTGGISAITGKPVPFSDSQLDHMVSLDNGGTDGPHNWEWMEARYNQFKGARSEKEVKAKLIERGMRTESEWLLELNDDELKQYQDEQFVAYWETKFEKGDIANLSSEVITDMTNDEIDYVTKAWNNYVGEDNPRFIPRYGDRKAVINGKKMSYSRGGVVKPDKKDPDTWGWVNKDGKWVKDPNATFDSSQKAFKSSRASGGQKITREEIQMKLIGGKDEVTGQVYEGVLKTGDGYPPIPDEDEEQEMDDTMQDMLEYKLNKKAIIDKFKEDRKKNPKSSYESGKRVNKALKSQPWFRKWSKAEKKTDEYKEWKKKKDDFVLNAWQKELESK